MEDTELKEMEVGEASPPPQPGQVAGGQPKLSLRNTLTKWFVDCITAGAVMNTVAFLVLMGIMKGQPGSQIGLNIRNVSFLLRVEDYDAQQGLFGPRKPSLSLWRVTRSGRLHLSSALASFRYIGALCFLALSVSSGAFT